MAGVRAWVANTPLVTIKKSSWEPASQEVNRHLTRAGRRQRAHKDVESRMHFLCNPAAGQIHDHAVLTSWWTFMHELCVKCGLMKASAKCPKWEAARRGTAHAAAVTKTRAASVEESGIVPVVPVVPAATVSSATGVLVAGMKRSAGEAYSGTALRLRDAVVECIKSSNKAQVALRAAPRGDASVDAAYSTLRALHRLLYNAETVLNDAKRGAGAEVEVVSLLHKVADLTLEVETALLSSRAEDAHAAVRAMVLNIRTATELYDEPVAAAAAMPAAVLTCDDPVRQPPAASARAAVDPDTLEVFDGVMEVSSNDDDEGADGDASQHSALPLC